MSEQRYPFDDFKRDYEEVKTRFAEAPEVEGEEVFHLLSECSRYMKTVYPDNQERIYKHGRFSLIVMYLYQHFNGLDQDKYGAIVQADLLKAVHQSFLRDESDFEDDPSPDEIRAIAERYRM